jgi:hypothetical protein
MPGWSSTPTMPATQLEGGINHATSMTLKEQVTLDGDGIISLDWDRYPILRFSEVPEIDTVIIPNPDQPTLGMGECTFGPTAAAIGYTLYHALEVRIRDMPLTGERIAAALVSYSVGRHCLEVWSDNKARSGLCRPSWAQDNGSRIYKRVFILH